MLSWCSPRPCSAAPVDFVTQIKPLLARHCFACHGPGVSSGGLRFNSQQAAFAQLNSGARAITPGNIGASELIARVKSHDPETRMPPEGKPLSPEEIALLERWIAEGADWKNHWAFSPIQKSIPSEVQDREWVINPIDAFVLAKLEAADLKPARLADRRTLARRAYYDLTGLPPSFEEVQAFAADTSPTAWSDLIDKLLASPHHGEHWARHWLDVVRYAETNSFERDGPKPNAWKYRDYVIRAFNNDKPYDEFVREQLAGDELDEVTQDSIIATGYYRLGIWDDEPADPVQARADERDDWVNTTSQAFLGLTLGCARCHDHKIDPLPQTDYYGLAAFFADVTSYGVAGDELTNNQWQFGDPELLAARAKIDKREQEIDAEKVSMEEVGIQRMSAEDQRRSETYERQELLDDKLLKFLNASEASQYQETVRRLEKIHRERDALPPIDAALAVAKCDARPETTRLMVRGNPHVPGDEVEPQFPQIFGAPSPIIAPAADGARSAGRRRVLADWIASEQNWLTARVIVNRVWQHHFGRGIVRSANNFGELGDPPTHPELLDWLAVWLMEHEWRLKPLHQLIMASRTYQMSGQSNPAALAVDPTNDLLWRFDLRRLSGEEVRDSSLVAAGSLTRDLYGPSVYPRLAKEVLLTQSMPGKGWGKSTPDQQNRRSIYIHVKRSLLEPLLTAFDLPDVDSSCEARFVTTQPQQALTLLNSEFSNRQAQKLAKRVQQNSSEPRLQVAESIRIALAREPSSTELSTGLELIADFQQQHSYSYDQALQQWCLVVLNLNEFLYVD